MLTHPIHAVIWGVDGTAPPAPAQVSTIAGESGELMALGGLAHVGETEARPAPSWLAVAGFGSEADARAWYQRTGALLPGAVLLVPTHTEPVWWPDELRAQRPAWSREPTALPHPPSLFVSVWSHVGDPDTFFDYAKHFKWTVERNGGAWLGSGLPNTLGDLPGPTATALMAWPSNDVRRTWYDGADYRPYKEQRMASSDSTVVGVAAL